MFYLFSYSTNILYLLLLYKGWRSQRSQNGELTQWRAGNRPQIMMNVDMALGYPIDTTVLPPAPGVTSQACRARGNTNNHPVCTNPPDNTTPDTFALARQFADNNRQFQVAFVEAFNRIAAVCYGGVPSAAEGSTATGKLGTLTTIDLSTC